MRAGIVWLIAAVCGITAFGATLIARAPQLPRQPLWRPGGGAFRAAGGVRFLPESLESLEAAAKMSPDLRTLYHLARRYAWADRPADAANTWREVARLAGEQTRSDDSSGRTAFSFLALGEAQRALGDGDFGRGAFAEAISRYIAMVSERGEDPLFFYRLGWCSYCLGDQAGVVKYFDRVEELLTRPDDRLDLASLYQLAAARSMRGNYGQSIRAIEAMEAAGFADGEMLEGAEEFAGVRGDPEFRAILSRIKVPKKAGQ